MRSNRQTLKQAPSGEIYVSESVSQCACVKWFRTVHKEYAEDLFSIPNGGKIDSKKTKSGHNIGAGILKAEGLTEGVSDLLLSLPINGFHGMFIEMKTPIGSVSKEQREFLTRKAKQGYATILCRRQNDFEKQVGLYLSGKFTQSLIFK